MGTDMKAEVWVTHTDDYRVHALTLNYVPRDYGFFGMLRGVRFQEPTVTANCWMLGPELARHPYGCCVRAAMSEDGFCEAPHEIPEWAQIEDYRSRPGLVTYSQLWSVRDLLYRAYPTDMPRPWLDGLLAFMAGIDLERKQGMSGKETYLAFGFDQ